MWMMNINDAAPAKIPVAYWNKDVMHTIYFFGFHKPCYETPYIVTL